MTRDTHNRTPRIAAGLAVAILMIGLAPAPPASAQVSDQGGFFSPQGLVRAHDIIQDIRQRTGKRVVVETYPAIPADRRASYSDAQKAPFFENWMVDRATATDADVFVLVNKNPGYVKVGSSKATRQQALPRSDFERAASTMLESFRAKDYDKGLLDTLGYLDSRMAQNLGAARQPAGSPAAPSGAPPALPRSSSGGANTGNPANAPTGSRRSVCGSIGTGGICLIIGVVGLFLIARSMMKRRQMTGGGGRGFPVGGAGYGQPGYGQPGYGQPGYGPPAGGGGFGRGVLGGLLGGVLGGAAYDHFRGGHGGAQAAPPPADPGGGGYMPPAPQEPFNPPSGFESTDVSAGGAFDAGGGDSGGGGFDSGGGGFDSGGGGGGDSTGGEF